MKVILIKSEAFGDKEVLVDDEDFEYLMRWKWHLQKGRNTFYCCRHGHDRKIGNKLPNVWLHREVLGLPNDVENPVDHIDHNGLNCQKYNLRISTRSKNAANRKGYGSSKYLGVGYDISVRRWRVSIQHNKKRSHIGCFKDEIEAAKAYDKKAKELHGEFANLNFTIDSETDNHSSPSYDKEVA